MLDVSSCDQRWQIYTHNNVITYSDITMDILATSFPIVMS